MVACAPGPAIVQTRVPGGIDLRIGPAAEWKASKYSPIDAIGCLKGATGQASKLGFPPPPLTPAKKSGPLPHFPVNGSDCGIAGSMF